MATRFCDDSMEHYATNTTEKWTNSKKRLKMIPDMIGLWKDSKNQLVRVIYWDTDKKCWLAVLCPGLELMNFDADGIASNGTKLMERKRGDESF